MFYLRGYEKYSYHSRLAPLLLLPSIVHTKYVYSFSNSSSPCCLRSISLLFLFPTPFFLFSFPTLWTIPKYSEIKHLVVEGRQLSLLVVTTVTSAGRTTARYIYTVCFLTHFSDLISRFECNCNMNPAESCGH